MPTPPSPTPGLQSLYWRDFTIRRALRSMVMGLVFAAGIWWVTQPVPNALPSAQAPFEVTYGPWVSLGGVVVSILAGIVFLRRYQLVKAILGRGENIKGQVVKLDVYETTNHSDSDTMKTTTSRAYYVTLRYFVRGADRQVRIKLFHSPFTYGLRQGGEVDLIVLDSALQKPLIRTVYVGNAGMPRWAQTK